MEIGAVIALGVCSVVFCVAGYAMGYNTGRHDGYMRALDQIEEDARTDKPEAVGYRKRADYDASPTYIPTYNGD